MKLMLALLALVPLSLGASACGSSDTSVSSAAHVSGTSSATTTTATINDSVDGDNLSGVRSNYEDNDDLEVERYGRPARANETRAATAVARRFLAAAAAGDGPTACTLIVAKLTTKIAQGMGKPPSPAYLRGNTCAEVMSKLLGHFHHRLALEASGFEVTAVRISGKVAFVLLKFNKTPERRYIPLEREGHAWKVEGLLDSEFP